jgi:hypothetical protein
MKEENSYHILTLVIQKDADIPRVRSKVKLLVRAIGGPMPQVTGIAVGASESARLLLQRYGGGKVSVSLFPVDRFPVVGCGVEMVFQANDGCIQGALCPLDTASLLGLPPFPGLRRVFAEVRVEGGVRGRRLVVRCRSRDLGVDWQEVHDHLSSIRGELFADTEESYMENLRAKHDEVTRLLKEKTEQNRLLDQSNNELLQLSNDLEELARERTIIEMSLRIADQVRNPATVIGGMARRLLQKGALEEKEKKKIHLIAAEADKIEQIVKQFNTMAARRRTVFSRENLVTLLRDALQACPTLQRRHIRATVHGPEKEVAVHANRQILKIALVHVLRYLSRQLEDGADLEIAISGERGAVVRFAAARDEDLVVPAGTENENLQEQGEQKGRVPGLGLVRQILDEHQAEMEVIDIEHGGGVVIRFPVVLREQDMDVKE